jgi:hypothetical protein
VITLSKFGGDNFRLDQEHAAEPALNLGRREF